MPCPLLYRSPHACRISCGQCSSHVASTTVLATLNECRFVLQDGQCLLQSVDLGLALPLALLVRLRLGDALSAELALVLDILLAGGLQELVLLCVLLVRLGTRSLFGLRLCKVVREVLLAHFEEVDDRLTSTSCLAVGLCGGWLLHEGGSTIVVAENAESLA